MPPITTTAKTTMIMSAPMMRVHRIDRRREHAGKTRQSHAEAVSQSDKR